MKELTIEESQKVSIEVLKYIADICEENNLRYYLIYGTLLGAIRHKGYIPWDDDVDIMMPRADYDKFIKLMEEQLKDHEFLELFTPDKKDYPYMISRISDKRYKIVMENEKDCGMGVFVDIYPFDGVGNDYNNAVKVAGTADLWSSICFWSTRKHPTHKGVSSLKRKILIYPSFFLAKIIGKKKCMKKLNAMANIYDYDSSEYVCCMVWKVNGEKELFRRELFDEYEMADYEQYKFRIPRRYDEILTQNYGNYHEPPPENERVGHHFYKVYSLME